MNGVAGKKNASFCISFGNYAASRPHAGAEPFDLEWAPHSSTQIRLPVDPLGIEDTAGVEHHQPPYGIYWIDHAYVRPYAVPIDGDEERRRLTTANLQKIGRAEIQVDRISQRLAAEPDAKRAAHRAICTIASYEVVGLDVLALTALEVDDFCADAVLPRRKGFEPCAVLQAYLGKHPGETLQDRIEPHLRAHLQPHRAVRLRLLAHARRAQHAADLIA